VEDEAGVRSLAALDLRELGYAVIEAADGEGALRAASRHEGQIDLLMTDIVLPGMDGGQVHDAVVRARPGIRVLFITAYAETHLFRSRMIDGGHPVLEKPFTTEELAAAVRAALGS
jgi:CheY-like chemotaxis protein